MTTSIVASIPAADSVSALEHFSALLRYETDCWDVNAALTSGNPDFVLVDVRGRGAWTEGHIRGAVHIPHPDLTDENLAEYPKETLFVVYCAGPHCNGADRAGVKLATLGRPVKKMIGGVTGWIDEGFDLV